MKNNKPPKRVFILGAGFSHHLSGKIFPLTNQLTTHIKDSITDSDFQQFFQPCSHGDNIEKVLSRLDLSNRISEERKTELKNRVRDTMIRKLLVQKIYSTNGNIINEAQNLVKELFKKDDVIITLNYDLLLEHILTKSDINMWSPFGNGYGKTFLKYDPALNEEGCNNQEKQN
ncbi:hypothetical protein ACFLZV_05715 [Candidatus Margulisiibacteriota bacterium]